MSNTTTTASDVGSDNVPVMSETSLAPALSANRRVVATGLERVGQTIAAVEQLVELLTTAPAAVLASLDYNLPDHFKLSVIVPVYNEAATIHEILGRIGHLPIPKEIIIVDDRSTDGTRELLKPLETIPDVQIVYKSNNEGKGAALRTGFRFASGDIVVVQDADLEYDPQDIPSLLEPILAGDADVVYGSRFLHENPLATSRFHRVGNGMLTAASNLFTGLRLTDMETCYKAFRRTVLSSLDIEQNCFGFEPEVTAKLARRHYRIREIPIRYTARSYKDGKKIRLKDLFKALYCIVRYGLAD